MEKDRVCHVCLVTEVKMFDLQSSPLNAYFLEMIGGNPMVTYGPMGLHPCVCFKCAALLQKYHKFRRQCLDAQAMLYALADSDGKIEPSKLKSLDREDLQVVCRLSHKNVTDESTIYCMYSDTECYSIKIELTEEKSPDVKAEDSNVKMEKIDEFPSKDAGASSDENEPLPHRKPRKVGNKRSISIEIEKMEVDSGEYCDVNVDQPKLEKDAKVLIPKKTRGRQVKTRKVKAEVKDPKVGKKKTQSEGVEKYANIIRLSVEEQIAELNKRKESSNYLNALYQCNLCYKGYIDNESWQHHHLSKHAPSAGDLECRVCKFRFKTKRSLRKHTSNHDRKYECKSCSYVSKTSTQAQHHQKWHKGVTYPCQHCDQIFSKWTSYMSHVRIKHPSQFICGVCGYSFVSELGLTMHKTMMHKQQAEKPENADEGSHYCKECDVTFTSTESWKRHLVISDKHNINSKTNNGCRVCGETFASKDELRAHHRKTHARKLPKNYAKKPVNQGQWPAQCKLCPEMIPNARLHWGHYRRVHPDQPYPIQKDYVCDICGKSFRFNAFLGYHRRTHFEDRQYKCTQCSKAFYNRSNLQMHERTHSDSRPYPCSVCFKAFKGKGALSRHFMSHTGQKPYECEVCGKAFSQSNSRKVHVMTVHLKQPAPYVSRVKSERRTKVPQKDNPGTSVF